MKKKSIVIAFTTALLFAATLTGCGNKEASPKAVEEAAVDEPAEAAEETLPEEPPVVEKAWYMDEKNYIQWTNEDFLNADGIHMFPHLVTVSVPYLEGVTQVEENKTEKKTYCGYATTFDGGYFELSINNSFITETDIGRAYGEADENENMTVEEIGTFVFLHPVEGNQERIWENEILVFDIENMSEMRFSLHCDTKGGVLEGGYEFRDNLIQEIRTSLQTDNKIATKAPEEEETADRLTTLTEATQHQISAFIGSVDNYYSEKAFPSAETTAEDCMVLLKNYLNDCEYVPTSNKDDMPFSWQESHISRDEFDLFFEKGWGIEDIPDGFSYTALNDYDPSLPYGVSISEDGNWKSNVDGSMYAACGGNVEITGYADGVYTLSGSFQNGASDDESLTKKTFTATAIESGEGQIYDGLQITGFEVSQ